MAPRPETDRVVTDRAQGEADRLLLGKSPYGTIARIVGFVVLFILIFGTIMYVLNGMG